MRELRGRGRRSRGRAVVIIGPLATAFRSDLGEQGPQGHVVLGEHAVAAQLGERTEFCGNLGPIGVRMGQEVLEEGIHVHGFHPSLAGERQQVSL